PGGVYAINASTGAVTLTAAGAALVNAGGDLPPVEVTVTDGTTPVAGSVNVPATSDVNDAPVLSLTTPATPVEGNAAEGNLISTASATDEDTPASGLSFSLTNNPGGVYASAAG
ncbi:hypothetical protein GT020_18920, partial [Glutamicibacter soli]